MKMTEDGLDLMDWKNVELSGEKSIYDAKKAIVLDEIMVRHAKREIKRLDGKTSEEEKELEKSKKFKEKVKPEVKEDRVKK